MKSIDQTSFIASGTASGSGRAHQALPRLDPQVQLQLALDPIVLPVVPAEALDVAQVQEAQAEASVAIGRCQPYQPVSDPDVLLVRLGLIAVAGLADLAGQAGVPDVRVPAFHRRLWRNRGWNWPRWTGYIGTTTSDCWGRSGASRRRKPKRLTIGNKSVRTRRPDSNQTAFRNPGAVQHAQPASFCLTSLLTSPMSAWPASAGLSTPISLPMSAAEAAPVALIALSISARMAASSSLAGR